jgi:hypothetical protein
MTTTQSPSQEVVLSTRKDAERVLEALIDVVKRYSNATIQDLYDLTGLPTTYVHHKWGWTSLENIQIKQVENGYVLDLPPAEEI